jgi:hypothetical protein
MHIDIDWNTIPTEHLARVELAVEQFKRLLAPMEDDLELEVGIHRLPTTPSGQFVLGLNVKAQIDADEPMKKQQIPLVYRINEEHPDDVTDRLANTLLRELRESRRRIRKRLSEMTILEEAV